MCSYDRNLFTFANVIMTRCIDIYTSTLQSKIPWGCSWGVCLTARCDCAHVSRGLLWHICSLGSWSYDLRPGWHNPAWAPWQHSSHSSITNSDNHPFHTHWPCWSQLQSFDTQWHQHSLATHHILNTPCCLDVDVLPTVIQYNINPVRRFFTGLMTQPTVSNHWKRVVSHPDRPLSNHAHLTVLQYYNMHADITQENNPTHTK